MITTCGNCGNCYEAGSEEQANEPTRYCPACRRQQSAHTPGPWHCQHESKYQTQGPRVYKQWGNAGTQQLVADASAHDENSAECLANARLIAAAPDLLTACRLAIAPLRNYRNSTFGAAIAGRVVAHASESKVLDGLDAVILIATNAIAKAEGGTRGASRISTPEDVVDPRSAPEAPLVALGPDSTDLTARARGTDA